MNRVGHGQVAAPSRSGWAQPVGVDRAGNGQAAAPWLSQRLPPVHRYRAGDGQAAPWPSRRLPRVRTYGAGDVRPAALSLSRCYRPGDEQLAALFRCGACLRFVRIVRGKGSLRRLDCRGAEIAPFDDNVVAKARCCLSFRRRPPFQQPLTSAEERIVPTLPRKIGRRRTGAIRTCRPSRRSCRRRFRSVFPLATPFATCPFRLLPGE